MDIKARIEEVIAQKGLTKKEVAERMGKFHQAFNSLITNPKWDTIEQVAQAIGITTKELLFDFIATVPQTPISDSEEPYEHRNQTEIPRTIGMLVCPHCGKGIAIRTSTI